MEVVSREDTLRFLGSLWIRWGQQLITRITEIQGLSPAQREAVEGVVLRPNDWLVEVTPPLSDAI